MSCLQVVHSPLFFFFKNMERANILTDCKAKSNIRFLFNIIVLLSSKGKSVFGVKDMVKEIYLWNFYKLLDAHMMSDLIKKYVVL